MLFTPGLAGSASRRLKLDDCRAYKSNVAHVSSSSSSSSSHCRFTGCQQARRVPRQQRRAATGDSGDQTVSAEELAAYNDYLKEKKATRQAALQDMKRKRKFNPLHTRMRISPAQAEAEQQPSDADAGGAENSGTSSSTAAQATSPVSNPDLQTSKGAKFAARQRLAPNILQQQQQQQAQQQQSQNAPAAGQPAAAAAAPEVTPPCALPSSRPSQSSSMLPLEPDEDEDFGAILAELLADGSDIPDVEEVVVPVQRQQSTAQLKAAAVALRQQQQQSGQTPSAPAARRRQSVYEERVAMPTYKGKGRLGSSSSSGGMGAAGSLLQQLTAAMQAEEAAEAAAAEGGTSDQQEDEDDLDWEALGQYEQLESYLHQLQKDKAAPHRALAASAGSKAETGRTPRKPGTKAAAAAVTGGVLPSAQDALSKLSSGAEKQKKQGKAEKLKTSSGSGNCQAAAGRSQLDRDLDEMEELVAFLEVMQAGGSGSEPQRPKGSAAASTDAGAAQDPGEAALKALLGEDWEAELMDDLAAVIDEDADQPQRQQLMAAADNQHASSGHAGFAGGSAAAAGPDSDGAAAGAGDDAPWSDDITGLLLGLVTISHQKYLGAPIPLPDIESVGEEGRCKAFYDAPFALFVVDDSMQSSIEYVNAAAEGMFGSSYLELFGQPAHTLVAADMDAQADWAFAGRQVEASSAFSCKLPQLLLQNMSGRAVVGQDVTVWRVDSLESTPIGMAVLVQRWRPAAANPDKANIDD